MSEKINLGLLGISENWGYLQPLCQQSFLVLAVTLSEEHKFANPVPGAQILGFDEMCREPSIEAIFVSLPTSLKCSWILKCLKAGKAIITEPPLCSNAAEATQIRRASELANQSVTVLPYIPDGFPSFADVDTIHSEIVMLDKGNLSNPFLSGGAIISIGSYWIHQMAATFNKPLLVAECKILESITQEQNNVETIISLKANVDEIKLHLKGCLTTTASDIKNDIEIVSQSGGKIKLDGLNWKQLVNPFLSAAINVRSGKTCELDYLTSSQIDKLYLEKNLPVPGTIKGTLKFPDPWETLPGSMDIFLSAKEIQEQRMNNLTLQFASLQLHTKGFVVLHNAISSDYLAELQKGFNDVYEDCSATKSESMIKISEKFKAVFWDDCGRRRMFPKLSPPFDNELLIANPFVMQVLSSLMSNFYCAYVSSDTNQPGSGLQAPHRDTPFYEVTEHRFYVVNIPLVDISMELGPMEIWPVTHHINCSIKDGIEKQDAWNIEAERLAQTMPSQLLLSRAGTVLIRSPGVWHRGTPNVSNVIRPMLTLGYSKNNFLMNYGTGWNWDNDHPIAKNPHIGRLFKAKYYPF